jgi:hypothetical protein
MFYNTFDLMEQLIRSSLKIKKIYVELLLYINYT